MNSFAHHLRIAFRQLSKSPGFTLTAVLTLALGSAAPRQFFPSWKASFCGRFPSPIPTGSFC